MLWLPSREIIIPHMPFGAARASTTAVQSGFTMPSILDASLVAEKSVQDDANGGVYTPPAGTTLLMGFLFARVAFGVTVTGISMTWDGNAMTNRIPRQASGSEEFFISAFSYDNPGELELSLVWTSAGSIGLRSSTLIAVSLADVGGWGTAQGAWNDTGTEASSGGQEITTVQPNSLVIGGFAVENPDADGTFFAPGAGNTEQIESSTGTGSVVHNAAVVNTIEAPTIGAYSILSGWDVSRRFAVGAVEVKGVS